MQGQNGKVHINTKPQITKISLQSSEIKQTIYLLLRDKKKCFSSICNGFEGKKIAHSTLLQIYVCTSLLSADAVQTYKDSSKVIPLLLRTRNHKLEPIFCQTETILEKKKRSPYLGFVFRAQNKPS